MSFGLAMRMLSLAQRFHSDFTRSTHRLHAVNNEDGHHSHNRAATVYSPTFHL